MPTSQPLYLKLVCLFLLALLTLSGQQPMRPPLVRSWTIREIGTYKKIGTATLRTKMQQRGVLFAVDEPYDQNKVDGTVLLLKQLYKELNINVSVVSSRIAAGPNAVKVEYTVHQTP